MALAGKTGTSQVRRISRAERATGVRKNEDKPWEERDHALFVAFAPYREPRYALAVVVEHGGSGSQAAAPLARDIMAKALELDPTRARPPLTAEREPRRARGRSGMSALTVAARFKTVELSLLEKLRLLNWPFVLIVALVALVGYGMLYSAAGGVARALGLAPQRALLRRPRGDAGDRADRRPVLVPLGLSDLRRGAARR